MWQLKNWNMDKWFLWYEPLVSLSYNSSFLNGLNANKCISLSLWMATKKKKLNKERRKCTKSVKVKEFCWVTSGKSNKDTFDTHLIGFLIISGFRWFCCPLLRLKLCPMLDVVLWSANSESTTTPLSALLLWWGYGSWRWSWELVVLL